MTDLYLLGGAPKNVQSENKNLRPAWKVYRDRMWPHAARQIKNFMLACISEGRNPTDEEETAYRRGVNLACKLTHTEI